MKLIQLTDLHIHKDLDHKIFGLVNTNSTFLDVLSKVIKEKPDIIIITGDISQDGSIESYQRLRDYISSLNCKIYVIPGNHDDPINMKNNLICNYIKWERFLFSDFGNLIFLNSYKENSDSGFLNKIELSELDNLLSLNNNCIPIIHHHFIKLNSLIDNYILENSQDFLNIILKYKHHIKFCIHGHVHNHFKCEINQIPVYSGGSTCIQFARTQNLLFDNKKPSYTIYNITSNNYEVTEKFA